MIHHAWKYTIAGSGVTESDVTRWLAAAHFPSNVSVIYDPNIQTYEQDWSYYGIWTWPVAEWNFVINNSEKPVGGLGFPRKFAIARWSFDDDWSLGNRIWHEMLHAIDIDADALNPSLPGGGDVPAFCNYVKTDSRWSSDTEVAAYCKSPYNNPGNQVLRAYYTMLWESAVPVYMTGVNSTYSANIGDPVYVHGMLTNRSSTDSPGNHVVKLYVNDTYYGSTVMPSVPSGQWSSVTTSYTAPAQYGGTTVKNCLNLG